MAAAGAQAEPLSIRERAWNGLSELHELTVQAGIETASPTRLEIDKLDRNDAILIVHPERVPPIAELAAFVRKGGRLAVADDFGSGDVLLQAFGIGRSELEPTRDLPEHGEASTELRGNPMLRLAKRNNVDHPLAHGVPALVTNHPAVLQHPQLVPVFALADRGGAVVLSGVVGDGRLVAISDSSVLINNMLELDANHTFAQNLVRYLSAERHGKLYIVDSGVELVGSPGHFDTSHPLRGLSDALAKMASVQLPRRAVVSITIVLAALLLAAAATSLPRRSAYARRLLETPELTTGFAGRVRHHARRRSDFLAPALTLKTELEQRLIATLRLRGHPQLKDTLRALRERGLSEASVERTRSLLVELDALHTRAQGSAERVPERKFVELVARGRSILADLERAARPLSKRP
ncbi:MAG TPA: DUF4350 domain-containing protein [Polyangiales bacterium]|nr:DUF4350 domain-containing protein [Polyangiales bacterium]